MNMNEKISNFIEPKVNRSADAGIIEIKAGFQYDPNHKRVISCEGEFKIKIIEGVVEVTMVSKNKTSLSKKIENRFKNEVADCLMSWPEREKYFGAINNKAVEDKKIFSPKLTKKMKREAGYLAWRERQRGGRDPEE